MGKIVRTVLQVAAIAVNFIPGIGQLASLAISAALSIGASLLAPKPKSPRNSRENLDRLRANLDPLAPRKTVVGITALCTDIRDEEFTGSQEYFHRFIVCASHKVQSIDEIWFDDKRVWTSGGGVEGEAVGYLTVATRTEGSAANAINISARMGTTRRYTGLAYVHLRYKLTGNTRRTDSPYAQSITTRITIRGKAAFLPDPRDSGQDMADQSTWAWDDDACRNPALALLFYLLGWSINGKLAVGKGIPPDRIDLDSFITAANICDEPVTKIGGGTEPRYRCDGAWSEGDDPTTVIDMLKATMNADLDDVGGKLRLTVFHNDLATPDADFDDNDIIDGFTWQPQPPLDATFNVVRGLYTDPSNDSLYQQADYPEQRETSPDGIDRIETFNLPMVQSAGQAQRLAQIRLKRQEYAGVFDAEFQATAWAVTKNSVVRLSFAQTGFTDKLFRVAEIAIQQDGRVPLKLREENAAIYGAPSLAAPVTPVPSTPYDPTLNPLVEAINQGLVRIEDVAPFAIQADATGVTTTELPITRQMVLTSSGVDVSADATWSLPQVSGGITATIGVDGLLSISAANAGGAITVRAVYEGVTYEKVAQVARTISGGTSGGGTGSSSFTDFNWENATTTSFARVTDTGAIVQSNASGQLQFEASASYYANVSASIKVQTSPDNTTWTDVGGSEVGTNEPIPDINFVTLSRTATGLTANTDYYVRLVAKADSAGTISWIAPTLTVSQP